MSKWFRLLFLYIAASILSQPVFAASSEEIIDGFSEFIIERADANLIAVFERRLKNDKNFRCYFPNTYEKIDQIRLDNLFASRRYWEDELESDLEIFIYRSLYQETKSALELFNSSKVREFLKSDKPIEILQLFEYEWQGNRYQLNFIPLDVPDQLKKEINWFSNIFDTLSSFTSDYKSSLLQFDLCEIVKQDSDDLKALIQNHVDFANRLIQLSDEIRENISNLRISTNALTSQVCQELSITEPDCQVIRRNPEKSVDRLLRATFPEALNSALSKVKQVNRVYSAISRRVQTEIDAIEQIKVLVMTLDDSKIDVNKINSLLDDAIILSNDKTKDDLNLKQLQDALTIKLNATGVEEARRKVLARVMSSIKSKIDESQDIEVKRINEQLRKFVNGKNLQSYTDTALVSLELLEDSTAFSTASYARLKNSVMFFASIADANDKDGVKSILKAYTLPPVSYVEKRKQGEGAFISSYLGMAATDFDDRGSSQSVSGNGLFAPVGIEFNYGYDNGGSWSLMLAPIDLAYPINLKLAGIEEDVEFDELVAPSISFSYGLENYPLTFGVGYQRGRTLTDVNKAEDGYIIFVGFDMPLFRLF